jgi:hypothetical protein
MDSEMNGSKHSIYSPMSVTGKHCKHWLDQIMEHLTEITSLSAELLYWQEKEL